MIIQHTADKKNILFTPETIPERNTLDKTPGFLRQGLNFFIPNKQNILHNLYSRLSKKVKGIKYTKEIQDLIASDLRFKDLPEDFHFHTKPLTHQLLALRFAYTFGCFGLLLEPGLGKTKVILDFIWLIKAKKSLIVCPKPLRFVWEDEAEKHRPELKVYVVNTTNWEKEIPGVQAADVVVVNYDKAVSLIDHLESLQFDFIGVDEGLIKNHSTDRTKAITKLSKGIQYRSIMSGTLVNNSPLDIFAPVRMLEPGLVSESFYRFKEEYCLVSRHNRNIVVGFRNIQEVKDILSSCSIIMKKEEWLKDLPPKEFKHIYVQMGDKQRDYYHKLANNFLLIMDEVGAEIEVDNALTVLIKLTQISNGFIYYQENPEDTLEELYGNEPKRKSKVERKTYYFEDQPKAEALIKLINSEEFNKPEDSGGTLETRGELSDCNFIEECNSTDDQSSKSKCSSNRGENSNTKSSKQQIVFERICSGQSSRGVDVSTDTHTSSKPSCERSNRSYLSERDILNVQTSSRRAIIWFNMGAELNIIEQYLHNHGISFLTIKGGDKDIGGKVHNFNKSPAYRFLVCQAKTINYGVTIMGSEKDEGSDIVPEFDPIVSDEIFYSLNFSLEVFLQQQDRIHRIGQKRKCRYWMLLTNSPIERRIANRLEEKLLCNKEILVDISNNLDLVEV